MEKVHNPNSLVNVILKKKLEYFGHIARRDGGNLEKEVLLVAGWQRKAESQMD